MDTRVGKLVDECTRSGYTRWVYQRGGYTEGGYTRTGYFREVSIPGMGVLG